MARARALEAPLSDAQLWIEKEFGRVVRLSLPPDGGKVLLPCHTQERKTRCDTVVPGEPSVRTGFLSLAR